MTDVAPSETTPPAPPPEPSPSPRNMPSGLLSRSRPPEAEGAAAADLGQAQRRIPPLSFFRVPDRGEPRLRRQWLTYRAVVLGIATITALGLGTYLADVLNPLLIALLIAYVLNPIVERFEKRGVKRRYAVYVLFGAGFVLGGGALSFGLFNSSEQFSDIRAELVGERVLDEKDSNDKILVDQMIKNNDPLLRKDGSGRWFVDEDASGDRKVGMIERITAAVAPVSSQISSEKLGAFARTLEAQAGEALNVGVQASKGVQAFLMQLTNLVGYVFLVPLYTFFLLLSYSGMRDSVVAHLPGAYRDHLLEIAHKLDGQLAAFFRGRLVLALTKGALTAFGLSLCGVRFSFFIGMLAGVLSVVPLLGPLVGGGLAVIFAYESNGSWGARCLGVLIVIGVVEALEAAVYPLVIGRNVGLHPLALIVALFAFGKLFGLFGVLMAVPIACCVKILFEEFVLPELKALANERAAVPPDGTSGGRSAVTNQRAEASAASAPPPEPGGAPGT